jgi:signal recognition particle GTPase
LLGFTARHDKAARILGNHANIDIHVPNKWHQGMGDVVSLVEKAAATVSDEEAKKMQEKMMAAEFDFDGFLKSRPS